MGEVKNGLVNMKAMQKLPYFIIINACNKMFLDRICTSSQALP